MQCRADRERADRNFKSTFVPPAREHAPWHPPEAPVGGRVVPRVSRVGRRTRRSAPAPGLDAPRRTGRGGLTALPRDEGLGKGGLLPLLSARPSLRAQEQRATRVLSQSPSCQVRSAPHASESAIEACSGLKSRGFHGHQSHGSDSTRRARLLMAACVASPRDQLAGYALRTRRLGPH